MPDFRVLFIDDEEELVSALVERLDYRGIDGAYATDGKQALEKLAQENYDVVVLDLKLPGMSGEEVLAAINRDYPRIPVLMITGHGSALDNEVAEKPAGAFDLLAKPIDLEDLIRKMQEAIGSA